MCVEGLEISNDDDDGGVDDDEDDENILEDVDGDDDAFFFFFFILYHHFFANWPNRRTNERFFFFIRLSNIAFSFNDDVDDRTIMMNVVSCVWHDQSITSFIFISIIYIISFITIEYYECVYGRRLMGSNWISILLLLSSSFSIIYFMYIYSLNNGDGYWFITFVQRYLIDFLH